MKNLVTLVFLLFLSSSSYAQRYIDAQDIIKDLKNGKDIIISNATIKGTLDFTNMHEKLPELPKRSSWWNDGGSNKVPELIKVKIIFNNCVFRNNVLAYIPDEKSGYTFTADFNNTVKFVNCTFKRKAMFKYSVFNKNADFSGTNFRDDSTFKWAKFKDKSLFTKAKFEESATFKHTDFESFASFKGSTFLETATFKNTKFLDGVTFRNAKFEEDFNIKYMKVRGDFDITNMKVAFDLNAKYTKINGKNFNKSLIDN